MPLAGTLRQFALADVLGMIENGQRTGILVVTHAELQANIYFSAGQWVAAERVGATHVLAQQLVRAGLIAPEDFEMAFGVTFAQAGAIADQQLIRGLIGARLITAEQLRAFAAQDAMSLLSVVLGWPDGEFVFEDGIAPPQGRIALPLPVGPLVEQVYQQRRPAAPPPAAAVRPMQRVQQVPPEAVIAFADVDPKSGTAIQVSLEQWQMLSAVDGQTPLWAVAEDLNAPIQVIQQLASELVANRIAVVVGGDGYGY